MHFFHSWLKDHTRDRFFRNSILPGPWLKEQKALQHVIHKIGQKESQNTIKVLKSCFKIGMVEILCSQVVICCVSLEHSVCGHVVFEEK